MRHALRDPASKSTAEAHVEITKTAYAIDIRVDGYGARGMAPGHGSLAFLEIWEGKLRLIVFSDINQEDPTHTIDLSGALESNRKEGA